MTVDELNSRPDAERIVPIPAVEWAEVADGFEEVERHDTGVAGDLMIVRGELGLAAERSFNLKLGKGHGLWRSRGGE